MAETGSVLLAIDKRILRPVFQGLEQRFRVRVIVTDGRSTEGRHDAEPLQGRQQGSAFHGTAVVGMQNQLSRRYRLTMHRSRNTSLAKALLSIS
jgi:hypothetical protein